MPHAVRRDRQGIWFFDIVVSTPPEAVAAFRKVLKPDKAEFVLSQSLLHAAAFEVSRDEMPVYNVDSLSEEAREALWELLGCAHSDADGGQQGQARGPECGISASAQTAAGSATSGSVGPVGAGRGRSDCETLSPSPSLSPRRR